MYNLSGKVVEIIPGFIFDELYDLPEGYPAITDGTDKVHGELLSFTDSSVLTVIDDFEDCKPDNPLYNKENSGSTGQRKHNNECLCIIYDTRQD